MDKAIIESRVATIPRSELGEVQADHKIWEESDGDAHCIVTPHLLPTINVPESGDIALRQLDHIDLVTWLLRVPYE